MKNYLLLSHCGFVSLLGLTLFSCSPGAVHDNGASPATTSSTQGIPGGGPSPNTPGNAAGAGADWNSFNFNAQITGGLNSKFQAVSIDKINKTITLLLPLPFDASLSGLLGSTPVSKISGAVIALTQLPDLTPVLSVTLPLATLVKPVTGLLTQSLPNGDPLPDMTGGAAPSTQVILKAKLAISLYISPMSASVFVNTPFDPSISTHMILQDNNGNNVGGVYAIPYKPNQKDGGFYLVVNVPSGLADLILRNL